jgi:protoporphyrinogen/coproporphyrinogen III oxidase
VRQSPQYSVGHAGRLAAIERRLHVHAGLFGTGSGFGAIGIPDCISHGRRVASHVTAFLQSSGHTAHTMGRP